LAQPHLDSLETGIAGLPEFFGNRESLGKMIEQMLLVKRDRAAAAGRAAFATPTAEARKALRFIGPA
jgi:hypothetical protein